MNIFEYNLGGDVKHAVAKDLDDAYNRRAEVDPVYEYTPVKITEFELDGYTITVKKSKE